MQAAQEHDYSTWSNADLISRVTALEAQLRAQTLDPFTETPSKPAYRKRGDKPPGEFREDKYTTRLIALKFAYLGANYNGFEHHVGNATPLPTIEETLWRAMMKTKLIFPTKEEGRDENEVCWDGCEYSKCGRTDRGVSSFGQVIGIRVRSSRPPERANGLQDSRGEEGELNNFGAVEPADDQDDVLPISGEDFAPSNEDFDHIRDELPYIQILNRVLPDDIRVLAWCPTPPPEFSARFNCRERRYRYFFTNPAYLPLPGTRPSDAEDGNSNVLHKESEGWLNIDAMRSAATKYEGLHDFRNFCKIDVSKQITNFDRRIYHAGIYEVPDEQSDPQAHPLALQRPQLFYFEVRGSAFLWHQVRHLVAVLFLVGQGFEEPNVIDALFDVERFPGKPAYEMASDTPLVLWDCIFPDAESVTSASDNDEHGFSVSGYDDALQWVRGDDMISGMENPSGSLVGIDGGKYGRKGIMEDLWTLWRQRKMDEILTWSLMSHVACQPGVPRIDPSIHMKARRSDRVFDGNDQPRTVGRYVPFAQRKMADPPEVLNARFAARKGLGNGPPHIRGGWA